MFYICIYGHAHTHNDEHFIQEWGTQRHQLRSQPDQHKTAILLVYDKKQVIVETKKNLVSKIKAQLTYQTELMYSNTII